MLQNGKYNKENKIGKVRQSDQVGRGLEVVLRGKKLRIRENYLEVGLVKVDNLLVEVFECF